MSQVATFISNEVMVSLSQGERALLIVKLSDPLMLKFMHLQAETAKTQMSQLDPDAQPDAHKFIQAARELRQTWRFWTDLIAFAEDWAANSGTL